MACVILLRPDERRRAVVKKAGSFFPAFSF
jgi:hypothetical protein